MVCSSLSKKLFLAPAKINLFLHITGKRNDGYHLLQSFVAFADFGDEISVQPADQFSLTIDSPYPLENNKNNLIIRAAELLAQKLNKPLNLSIHLKKRIPIGGGIGGGSSDAGTTIKALLDFWDAEEPKDIVEQVLLPLGADTPICYHRESALVENIGEKISPVPPFPEIPAILVYPNAFGSTAEIFQNYSSAYSKPISLPTSFQNLHDLYLFLDKQKNDLKEAACKKIPIIEDCIQEIKKQDKCMIARMSGSGSTCFGLFNNQKSSIKAAKSIQKDHPDWWVKSVIINKNY